MIRLRNRGALVVISGLLVGSAAMRIILGAPAAFALAENAAPSQAPSSLVAQCSPDPALEPVLQDLNRRKARLDKREEKIRIRMQALAVTDREIEARLAELISAEAALRETLAMAEVAAEDDLTRLTAVYENMKPKQAAALFEKMAPEFAAGFLGRMRPDAAAGVMAGLSPKSAYSISVILAGRNANVPKE